MTQLLRLNRMLGELGKRDSILHFSLAADGTGGLELANGVRVHLEYHEQSERLLIYVALMSLPSGEQRRLSLFDAILDCNFMYARDGSLAVVRHLDCVVYRISLDARNADTRHIDDAIDLVLQQREELLLLVDRIAAQQSIVPNKVRPTSRRLPPPVART